MTGWGNNFTVRPPSSCTLDCCITMTVLLGYSLNLIITISTFTVTSTEGLILKFGEMI